jgi:hypothetical protein
MYTIRAAVTPNADSLARAIQKNLEQTRPYNISAIAASEKIQPLAEIVGSREPAVMVADHQTVFIEAEKSLEVGQTYSIVPATPDKVTHSRSDRTGYSYPLLGKIQIEGIRDGIYLGKLVKTRLPVERGSLLIPEVKTAEFPKPVAASKRITATLIPNTLQGFLLPGQYQEVFLDRGTVDGVQVGAVFRVHRHYDPLTERRLTEADFLVEADILVLQTSEEHSLGIIIQGHAPVLAGDDAVLLTDISDVGIHLPLMRLKGGGSEIENELDKLDQEGAGGLKKDEKRELEQLEEWKKNPPTPKEETPAATETPAQKTETSPPPSSVEDSALDNPATQGSTPAELPATPTEGTSLAPPAEVPATPSTAPPSLPAPPAEVPEGANDLIPPSG